MKALTRAMRAAIAMGIVALLGLTAGCGPDLYDVCNASFECNEGCGADECFFPETSDRRDCVNNAVVVEENASANGCGRELSGYYNCVVESKCKWRTACALQKDALEKCAGEFPN